MSLVQFADPKSVTLKSNVSSKKKKKEVAVMSDDDEGGRVPALRNKDAPPALHDEGYVGSGGVGGRGGWEGGGARRGERDQLVPSPQREQFLPVDHQSHERCQIIYITSIKGATHHGFIPIIKALARNQVNPATGLG
jgi:hypothetical protein